MDKKAGSGAGVAGWAIDGLKAQLAARVKAGELKGWIVTQEHVHRRERYFMMDGESLIPDQDREIHAQNIHAKLFVPLAGKPGRQGEISKKLFPTLPLGDQLDAAIESARQTDHQAWELPARAPADLPSLSTSDPRMAEDLEGVVRELTDRISVAVRKPRRTRFNSAELFLSVLDTELHLSNGLTHRSSQSRIYTEAAYSFTKPGPGGAPISDEYLNTRWAVSLDDLPVEELFDETSARAEHILQAVDESGAAVKPGTGKYPVIVDAEVLATLFGNQLAQLSSANSYHGLPFVKPGDELVPGLEADGAAGAERADALTITLDPSLPFGGDTTAVSDQGVPQTPFRLVERNRVLATATDKRYADYLGAGATTVRGNVVVDPGTRTHAELTRAAPKVIEILQFSGLFADPNSGTFGSEIRLARLYDNVTGQVRYLKGGSLSGSFTENFRGARLSRERVKRSQFSANSPYGEGYYGPEYALLSDVSIVG